MNDEYAAKLHLCFYIYSISCLKFYKYKSKKG